MSELTLFKNLKIFSVSEESDFARKTDEQIEELLLALPFRRAKEKQSAGFEAPHDQLETPCFAANNNILFMLKTEVKKISKSEKTELVKEKQKKWFDLNPDAQKLPKDEKNRIESEVESFLYREKFQSQFKEIYCWYNRDKNYLIINTTSDKLAAQILDVLDKAESFNNSEHETFGFKAVEVENDIPFELAKWVENSDKIPESIELGLECAIVGGSSSLANGSQITYKKQPLEKDNRLQAYLNNGYQIAQMKLSFTLEDEVSANFKINAEGDILGFKLGDEFKNILKSEEYDHSHLLEVLDVEFNHFTKMTMQVVNAVHEIFGGVSE